MFMYSAMKNMASFMLRFRVISATVRFHLGRSKGRQLVSANRDQEQAKAGQSGNHQPLGLKIHSSNPFPWLATIRSVETSRRILVTTDNPSVNRN